MFRVAVPCANLFHDEVEGGEAPLVVTTHVVEDREALDALLARGVDIHGRCYCGHVTPVASETAVLVDEPA